MAYNIVCGRFKAIKRDGNFGVVISESTITKQLQENKISEKHIFFFEKMRKDRLIVMKVVDGIIESYYTVSPAGEKAINEQEAANDARKERQDETCQNQEWKMMEQQQKEDRANGRNIYE